MNPYDQQKEDPEGYFLSIAVICGLLAIGGIVSGGPLVVVGIVAGAAAIAFFVKARASAS